MSVRGVEPKDKQNLIAIIANDFLDPIRISLEIYFICFLYVVIDRVYAQSPRQ